MTAHVSRGTMGSRRVLARAAVLLAVAVLAASGRTFRAERTIRHSVPVGAVPRVIIEHRYGSLNVTGQETRTANVEARVRVAAGDEQAAREFADGVEVRIRPRADSLAIVIFYPSSFEPDPTLSYEADLVIVLPAAAALAVRSVFGDVRMVGISGGSRVDTRYGNVEVERCSHLDIVGRHGGLLLEDVEGPVVVDHSYGDVVLRNTSGRVMIENRYGAVDAEGPNGDLQVVSRFGNVAARQNQGRLAIQNRYGRAVAWVDRSGLDMLRLASEMGRVELNLCPGLPFRLGGRVHAGQITSDLPLFVSEGDDGWSVSGRQGVGGPAIQLDGRWSDFVIQPDSDAAEAGFERR